jgi:4'-phosphopantetheinyl transferase
MEKTTDNHTLQPRAGGITVWRVALEVEPSRLPEYEAILGEDERVRAGRFRFPRDRRRFIASHAALREILAACLGLPAGEIRFTAGPYGKPSLEGDALHFNLSHSHELALIAVAEREVGVDIEHLDMSREAIAKTCCTPRELRDAVRLHAGALAYWTCKEAYLKGLGAGFSIPPAQIEVAPPPSPQTRAGVTRDPAWSIYPFVPAPGYCAAVAARGDDWQVEYCDWPGTTLR